jgi:AcrR family transcriptional regulator
MRAAAAGTGPTTDQRPVGRVDPRGAIGLPPHQRERRERIVRAALDLLETGEYEQIQMRDVALRADVALGTLYRYFASKEHLYAAVMMVWFRSFRRGIERERLPSEPRAAVREFSRRIVAAFERKPQFLRVEFVLEGSTDPYAVHQFAQSNSRYREAFREMLAGFDEAFVNQIERVMGCVLSTMLRQYALGRLSVEEVYAVVLGTVDLIFAPAPQPEPGLSRGRRRSPVG